MPALSRYKPLDDPQPPLPFVACYRLQAGLRRPLPLLLWRVCAGFPSPADGHVEEALDLNDFIALKT